MRASTLFALSIAILVGLGVVVYGRQAGWFTGRPAAEKKENPRVLVAKRNLFEGSAVSSTDVLVRPLRDDELQAYRKNQEKYLPAQALAAHMRVLAHSVPADTPLMFADFDELALPRSLSGRLEPGMRAVNIVLPSERAGGNLLQVDERVDVYVTADICADKACTNKVIRTAQLARGARIVAKRNNLWKIMAPIDDSKPLALTLEVNPYRAALIEYAKNKGTITLVPSALPRELTVRQPFGFSDPDSVEFNDESGKTGDFLSGKITVGDHDLMRIFQVRPVVASAAPPPIMVERYSGIALAGSHVFPASGRSNPGEPPLIEGVYSPTGAYSSPTFAPPSKGCPTCGKK